MISTDQNVLSYINVIKSNGNIYLMKDLNQLGTNRLEVTDNIDLFLQLRKLLRTKEIHY